MKKKRGDHVLDEDLPMPVPVPPIAEVQIALTDAVAKVTGLKGRDLKARYRGSVLGFLWSFINPLLLMLTYAAICIAVFKLFRIPLTKWTVPTAVLGGIVLIGALVVLTGVAGSGKSSLIEGSVSDRDGVVDNKDLCANTPSGAPVDAYGCISDVDGDGVTDDIDECPNTVQGAAIYVNGCERDDDGDDVVARDHGGAELVQVRERRGLARADAAGESE